MSRILVTGADGFVGRGLIASLSRSGNSVLAVGRRLQRIVLPRVNCLRIEDIRTANWTSMLQRVDAVIHLAARAHIVNDQSVSPLKEFREINVRPSSDLFCACQSAGIKRFVFVSSIGVNGVCTAGAPITESSSVNPTEPYAISKWEAEELLRAQFRTNSTGLTIVRPTLIYGPNAKGNFQRLMRLIDSPLPLPFGAADSKRSFLGLSAFCELIERCVLVPSREVQLFVAADDRSVTTVELIAALATAMDAPRKQWRVPLGLLSFLANAAHRSAEFHRLTSDLEVDSRHAEATLGWSSGLALGSDLKAMAESYMRTRHAT